MNGNITWNTLRLSKGLSMVQTNKVEQHVVQLCLKAGRCHSLVLFVALNQPIVQMGIIADLPKMCTSICTQTAIDVDEHLSGCHCQAVRKFVVQTKIILPLRWPEKKLIWIIIWGLYCPLTLVWGPCSLSCSKITSMPHVSYLGLIDARDLSVVTRTF